MANAQTADACTHGCQISAKHVFMRLSFVRLTLFLARLMARPRVTLLTSDTLSIIISSNVATLTGRLACELRLARTTQESHDSHISSGA